MVAGLWEPKVPAATIGGPGLRGAVVRRPRLVRSLLDVRGGDLVVVSAPAGYGKTTTVALWDDADARPFAWMRLDHLDNDPNHLLLHVASAVDRVAGLDDAVMRYLAGPGRAAGAQLIGVLAEALARCAPTILVLDDTHELTEPAAIDVLRALLDVAPATVAVVLMGRCAPPIDLARRRLRGDLVEIGVAELKLTVADASAAFEAIGGSSDPATVRSVVDKCEGWAAGVALAAMALREGADVAAITGRHRLVGDYLVEEVLNQLDTETTRFLMESAVLDRFCAEQLDTVLRRDDSARMLAAILRSGNAFLVPLDPHRMWYRYHGMFGDLLRARLRDSDPGRFRAVASRAADQLRKQGDIDGALVQAVAAADRALAAGLVGLEAVRLGFDGRAGVLARRLGKLDEQTFAEQPEAAIARAWLGVTTADAAEIQRSLTMAHQADRGLPMADGTPSVKVAAALVGSVIGVGGVREVVRHADTVIDAGDHLVNPWWGAATVMKGAALSMLGDRRRARALLESALPVIGGLPGFHAAALAHLALLDLGDGDDTRAAQRAAAARRTADDHDLGDVVPMVVVYAAAAVTSAGVGDIAAARDAIGRTEGLLGRLGHLAARTALLGHTVLASAAVTLGDAELAARHLAAAAAAHKREPDAVGLGSWLAAAAARAAGRGPGAERHPLTTAELRLLPHLATHLSLQRIAEELVISRETAKSQVASIYRKLGVSSRAAAVSEAKSLGLLRD